MVDTGACSLSTLDKLALVVMHGPPKGGSDTPAFGMARLFSTKTNHSVRQGSHSNVRCGCFTVLIAPPSISTDTSCDRSWASFAHIILLSILTALNDFKSQRLFSLRTAAMCVLPQEGNTKLNSRQWRGGKIPTQPSFSTETSKCHVRVLGAQGFIMYGQRSLVKEFSLGIVCLCNRHN